MSKFSGEGFSAKEFSDEERQQIRERMRHYDQYVAPYATLFAVIAIFRGKLFWGVSGAAGFAAYAFQNGWIGN